MASAGGSTVAFDSIDGPPPQVFDRMVSMLDSEAKLRNIPVVSREGGAAYRVRSYLSAQVRGSRTNIAWVWDVYDRNQQRALRLSGEEADRPLRPRCLGPGRRHRAAPDRPGRLHRPERLGERDVTRRAGPRAGCTGCARASDRQHRP